MAEEFSWKDSNVALLGSDQDKAVRKEAAETEPAWKDVLSISSCCTKVWRINKFKVEEVSEKDVGKFYQGDSYVILHVDGVGDEKIYDVHFWIGKNSTQDEYGTAAYKTVELDALLDDAATQHREVDEYESKVFKSYFPTFQKLKGGYDTGFQHVNPNEAPKRLFHFHGDDIKNVQLREVTCSRKALDSDDVFILEDGQEMIQWNGKGANKDERFCAMQYAHRFSENRTVTVVDETDIAGSESFKSTLPDIPVEAKKVLETGKKSIHRLSDESGKLDFTLVCEERLPKSVLADDDVYFINSGTELFVYIGDNCSRNEKMNALAHAHEYLKGTGHPFVPITVVSGNRKSKEMEKVLE